MSIRRELIDELLKDYPNPWDVASAHPTKTFCW